MTIKELCELSHKVAVEKGFWKIQSITSTNYPKMSTSKDYEPRNTSELLMLIVTELGEACEALRNNRRQPYRISEGFAKQDKKGRWITRVFPPKRIWEKDTFEDEIADTFIRLGDMCEALKIDIEWQIKKKMEYNKTRPNKHGKEF